MFSDHWMFWLIAAYGVGLFVNVWFTLEWAMQRRSRTRGEDKIASEKRALSLMFLISVVWPLVIAVLVGWAIASSTIFLAKMACDFLTTAEPPVAPPSSSLKSTEDACRRLGPYCPRCGQPVRPIPQRAKHHNSVNDDDESLAAVFESLDVPYMWIDTGRPRAVKRLDDGRWQDRV